MSDGPVIRVQEENFDTGTELAAVQAGLSGAGAIVSFVGLVRGTGDGGRRLRSMTIEHYPAMTEAEIARIAGEARQRWDLEALRAVHRYGTLLPGENIVLVITAAAHRQAAFEAAEFVMDYLKTRAPFWKMETFADGSTHWIEARDADEAAARNWAANWTENRAKPEPSLPP